RTSGRGGPAPVGAAFGGAVGQVGAVGGGAAVPHHLTRDRRGRTVQASGDLGVGKAVSQPQRDLLALLLGEPASRHRDLLGGPSCWSLIPHCSVHFSFIAMEERP